MPFTSALFFFSFFMFLSMSNWFMLWLIMELNTITFISMMALEKNKSEMAILYFIIQSLSSFFLISSMLYIESFSTYTPLNFIILLSIIMKLGVAPLHNWVIPVIQNSNAYILFSLLILQKVIPFLWILMMKIFLLSVTFLLCLLNLFWISPLNITQNSLKMFVGLSSMSHSSWILISTLSLKIWEIYFSFYTLLLGIIIFLSKENMKSLFQKNNPYLALIMLFMLGGLPPMMGFFPKFLILQETINIKMWLGSISLLILSLIDLFVYTRLGLIMSMDGKKKMKWLKSKIMGQLILINTVMMSALWV